MIRLELVCDRCGGRATFYGVTDAWARHNARENGWTISAAGLVYCSKCRRAK